MTSSGKRPKPLSSGEVRKLILEALKNESYVESSHARFDHPERMISIQDVLHGLERTWISCKADEFNEDEWQWKYRIITTDLDDTGLIIIVALDPKNVRFEVVTRFHD